MTIIHTFLFAGVSIWCFLKASSADLYESFAKFAALFFISLVLSCISFMCIWTMESYYKDYPVKYQATPTRTKWVIDTDYGVFDINNIEVTNNFRDGKPGYIRVSYNILGAECGGYQFLTK